MTDILIQTQLPHWDMSPLFPTLDSPAFAAAFDALAASVRELQRLFDDNDVRKPPSPAIDDTTVRVLAEVSFPDGRTERLPMSAVRGLAHDPDPAVREAAYRAEMATWPTVEVPLAAALNSIKGWQNAVNARRGYGDSLEPALRANNVDAATLDAMQQAVVESFPDFRRYLRAKAKLLGRNVLAWWDLSAPVGAEGGRWDWDETASFIVEQ